MSTRFDLSGLADRDRLYRRGQTVILSVFFLFFLGLGIVAVSIGLERPLSTPSTELVLGEGAACALVGGGLLLLLFLNRRWATAAEVGPEGVVWYPSQGKATKTDWSESELTLRLIDWRTNQFRQQGPTGPPNLLAVAPGAFIKVLSEACFDSIVSSAQGAGLVIDHRVYQVGTKYERAVIWISRGPAARK